MGRYRRSGLLVLALVAVTGLIGGAAVGSGAPASSPPGFDPDSVLLQASVHPNGSASWKVSYRLELDTPNESAAFGNLKSEIRSNPGRYERRFEARLSNTVRKAETASGRDMALRGTEVAAEKRQLPEEAGVVRYTFTWAGFAERDGDRLVVGEGLNGLPLDGETTLLLSWPESYRVDAVRPSPDERRPGVAVWNGPKTFAPDEPRLRLVPATPTPSPSPTGTTAGSGGADTDGQAARPGDGADGGDGSDSGDGASGGGVGLPLPWLLPLAGVTVLATVGLAGWLARRREWEPLASDDILDDGVAPETAAAGGAAASGKEEEVEGPPSELLSPEERVREALESHGGRMKQQELAGELDWSGPKASRVIGDLREEGAVEVFRLGRENVVTLPEEEL